MIIDECLTFFFAGSQTSAGNTDNLALHLMKHPEYTTRILSELQEKIIKKDKWNPEEILNYLNFENITELEFYSNCFSEALRMQPPVYFTSTVMMMENIEAAGLFLRKGDAITIDNYRLCNNPDEW